MASQLLILGASVRAAAQSARRAGLQPFAADMFADSDLSETCPAIRVTNYPLGLQAAAREFPLCPWIYTGGLENYPALIDAISTERPLFGNSGEVVRNVRDPWRLAEKLRSRGLLAPDLARFNSQPCDGEWLVKTLRSAGGTSIRRLDLASQIPATGLRRRQTHYLQRFIAGESAGAVFLGAMGQAKLVGVTKQLIGITGYNTKQFVYRGSIGPLALSSLQREQLLQISECLAGDLGLVGLFGVDVVLDGDQVWTIEVNPRYTASVEVLERAFGLNAMELHISCFTQLRSPSSSGLPRICGKEIVYANQNVVVDEAFLRNVTAKNANNHWPQVADISPTGTSVQAGHPICTVFADGESIEDVARTLKKHATEMKDLLQNR
jgi:predicted ATP-grasp superfamily ATP-dependent carboligase